MPVRHEFATVCMVAVLAAAGALGACTTPVAGRATGPSGSAAPPVAPTTGAPAPAVPCAGPGPDPAGVVHCLVADVSAFWTRRLHRAVPGRAVIGPQPADVPRQCRAAVSLGTAFYCPANHTVYLTAALVQRSRRAYGADLPYELATVLGHEFGHMVQDVVRQPGFNAGGNAAARRIEQQADCLLGVWARDAAGRRLLDPARLRAVARREYAAVERLPPPPQLHGYNERATHGTVTERVAALSRGLAAGDPAACALARPRAG